MPPPDKKKSAADNVEKQPDIEITEYELMPKTNSRRQKKVDDNLSLDQLLNEALPVAADVSQETSFKKQRKELQEVSDETLNIFSIGYLQNFSDQLIETIQLIERNKPLDIRDRDVAQRCFAVRECPDRTCSAYHALNPRCWFVAGEQCGCRTHLGIPSCFDCQVFEMATEHPIARIRETMFYLAGMIKHRHEKIRAIQKEIAELRSRLHETQETKKHEHLFVMDETLFEQQLISELVTFSKKTQTFDSEKDKEIFDQHKTLTEQLGNAYLQLQSMTAELERTNKDLEQKVLERTDDLRRSNMALRDAIKKTQDADRLKSEFIANVSHELRTPLNSIIGFSKVMMSGIDGEVNEAQRVDLSAIYNSGRHLLEIINSILELSKIEAGKTELNITAFDLVPIIEEIITASQTLIMGKRVKIESKILTAVPILEADVTKIRQIIFNLVSNASKFTEEGYITVQARADKERVFISVMDTGIGIDKDQLDIIFERFRQVDGSSTRRAGGTGLGLSIAKKFVEMHHGELTVESVPNKGSTFTMMLPVKYKLEM
jgi:signal transduction histidine kinase